MTAPWPEFGVGLVPYGLLFGLMLLGNGYVVIRLFPRAGGRPTLADATILIGILLMAMGLWFALIYAILDPGSASEVSVFIALNSMMGVVGCWAIALFLRAEAKPMAGPRWQWPGVFALLLVSNEFLMGVAFVLGEAGPSQYASEGWAGLATLVGDSVCSAWFFWAMLANMLLILYWLPMERPAKTALTGLAFTAAVGPWLVTAPLEGGARHDGSHDARPPRYGLGASPGAPRDRVPPKLGRRVGCLCHHGDRGGCVPGRTFGGVEDLRVRARHTGRDGWGACLPIALGPECRTSGAFPNSNSAVGNPGKPSLGGILGADLCAPPGVPARSRRASAGSWPGRELDVEHRPLGRRNIVEGCLYGGAR